MIRKITRVVFAASLLVLTACETTSQQDASATEPSVGSVANAKAELSTESKSKDSPSDETAAEAMTPCKNNEKPEDELVWKALEELEISRSDTPPGPVASRKFGCETLLVIPVLSGKHLGTELFDVHVVLSASDTGEILAHYSGKEDWTSDAVGLDKMEIDPTPRLLATTDANGSKFAYGVTVYYSNDSWLNPYSVRDFSLYQRAGARLEPVLKEHPVYIRRGEMEMECNGKFEERQKSLEVMDSQTNGYADLKFTESIEESEMAEPKCEPTVVKTSQKIEHLKFEDGGYAHSGSSQ